jgi:hypothetical protein
VDPPDPGRYTCVTSKTSLELDIMTKTGLVIVMMDIDIYDHFKFTVAVIFNVEFLH